MNLLPRRLGRIGGGHEDLILIERAITDRLVDSSDVLIHHATRPKIHVANLRVAHLARRKPDGQARSLKC